jgi:UDP-glucose 4-epimerase
VSRVLVTGGSGFIGSHVVDALVRAGHEPVIYDVVPSRWHRPEEVTFVKGALQDVDALTDALEGCQAVAHLAAAADVDIVQRDPLGAEDTNTRGTASMLEAARRADVSRVIYASTIWVYSDVDAAEVDEDCALQPPAHLYTATKLAGELYCRSYRELYDVESTILRFGIPYGPRARPAAVVPAMTARALAGEALTIAGDGLQTRRFVYVEDLAEGVVAALAPVAANRTYNLVSTEDVTIKRVAETICAITGGSGVEYKPGRSGDFAGAEIDGSRAATELGWTASTPFEVGVRRYIDSVREPHAVAVARAHPVADFWRVARQLLAPLALLGGVVACLAAAGSVEQVIDAAPVAAFAMALALPAALVRAGSWSPTGRLRLAKGFWIVSAALLLAMFIPAPGTGAATDHREVVLLIVAATVTAAIFAAGSPRAFLRDVNASG